MVASNAYAELEATRTPMYESFAQCIVEHNRNAPETVSAILEDFEVKLIIRRFTSVFLDKLKLIS